MEERRPGTPGRKPPAGTVLESEKEIPEAPEWLEDEAVDEWDLQAPRFRALNIVPADYAQIAVYCNCYRLIRKMNNAMEEEGLTYTNEKTGVVKGRPEFNWLFKASAEMVRIGGHFGFSPSARVRLPKGGATPGDVQQDLLNPDGSGWG